jgi:two-component system response regulator HydG
MNTSPRVAVVEDDPILLDILVRSMLGAGFDPVGYSDGAQFRTALEAGETPEVAVVDIRLPGTDGLELLRRLGEILPACRVIMVTAYKSFDSVLESLRLGATEFLLKPVTATEVVDAVQRSLRIRRLSGGVHEEVAAFAEQTDTDATGLSQIMGNSPAVSDMEAFVRKAGPADVPVLLSGETGTGKEVVARAIHAASSRGNRQMVVVNCGAIPEDLVEAELFGHLRGSFTGAHANRIGLMEAAHGSTLFLDEVGELPLKSQVKLLRSLQDGELRRVGDSRSIPVNIRVLAATNRNLDDDVGAGRFRQDLFYRLSVLRLHVPSLRDRREDIPYLVERFLGRYGRDRQSPGLEFSPGALRALQKYPWPGNVRELENEIARAVTLAEGDTIDLDDLSEDVRAVQALKGAGSLKVAMDRQERRMILSCLEQVGWNKTEAARILGMSRQNLYQRLEYHGIPRQPRQQQQDP